MSEPRRDVPRGIPVAVALVAALAALPAAAAAQVDDLSYGGGVAYERYSFSDADRAGIESIDLLTVPFGGRALLTPDLEVQLFGNVARGSVTGPDGSDASLLGLTDTDLQVDYTLGGDAVTLTGVVSLPTGTATHDAEESAVAGAVAADLLPFRITNWGRGGGVAVQAAGARSFDSFGAGLSLAYRMSGEFEPQEGAGFTYQPGDELRVQLALDTDVGAGGKGSLLLGFQNFSDDARDGTNVYRSGNRLNATASYAFPARGGGAGVLYAGVVHRSDGTSLGAAGGGDRPSQDLVLLGSRFRFTWGSARIQPRVDGRFFRSEDGRGQGYAAGAGASVELPGERITWTPNATVRFGNLEVTEGRESGFTGVEIGLRARFEQ